MGTDKNSEEPSKLTKFTLNNFLVKMRPAVSQSKVHVMTHLVRSAEKYHSKKGTEAQREKNKRRAEKIIQELMFIKTLHRDDIGKLVVANGKSFKDVGSDPNCSIEQRAVCRLSEHKAVKVEVRSFRKEYPNWAAELPDIFMGLGIRHRKQKLKRKQGKGVFKKYIKRERIVMQLLQDLCSHEWKNRFSCIEKNPLNTKEDFSLNSSKNVAKASNCNGKDIMETSGCLRDMSTVNKSDDETRMSLSDSDSEEEDSDDEDSEEVGSEEEDTGLVSDSEVSDVSMEKNVDDGELNTSQEEHQNTYSKEDKSENETLDFKHSYSENLKDSDLREANDQSGKDRLEKPSNGKLSKEKQLSGKVSKELLKTLNSAVKHKQNKKFSKTMVVKQLNLDGMTEQGVIEPVPDRSEGSTDEEACDEVMQKKKAGKISSFFIGGMDEEQSEDNDSDDENSMSSRPRFEESFRHDNYEEMEGSVIDSAKYFRKNMFRGDIPKVNVKGGLKKGPLSSERDVKYENDRKRRQQKFRGLEDNRRGGAKNYEQGNMKNRGKWGSGRFSDEHSSRRGGFHQRFSKDGRSQGDGNCGDRRHKFNSKESFRDESNPNMIPMALQKEFVPPQKKTAHVSASSAKEKLHPSWEAKKRLKTQASGVGQFQGSRIVFDE